MNIGLNVYNNKRLLQILKYQMNDLRLLQQVQPTKKVISLQFKQISALEQMLPLLSKFQYLQSLSLHGNRLKNLPKDMSSLASLAELDITNNLFTDISDLAESLKTLPSLTHLIMNFKSQQEQNFIKNSLPRLQRINKKAVSSHKSDFNYSHKIKKQVYKLYKLNETDFENAAMLYDQIRQIYRNSKYFVDKQLADDFDRNVENIMSQLTHKIKSNESELEKSCSILCGKYALIDLCFVKLITYFYHFDKKLASTFEKIHDQQADMFKSITDLVYAQALRSKIQVTQVRTQKQQLYKSQIRRLRTFQEQSVKQVEYLEAKNKQLIQKLIKHGKSNILQNTLNKSMNTPRSRSPIKNGGSTSPSHVKQNNTIVTIKNKPKALTLNQLKQIMLEIYESKQKQNLFCLQNSQPFQTMQTHMYTYLNQKYGLKSLALQWAISIVNGIKKYGPQDPEIATFGKILRNQVQQQFLSQVEKIKQAFNESYNKFKKNLSQNNENQSQQITLGQSQQILLFMHFKREQIDIIISKLREDTRFANNIIPKDMFLKIILDYYAKKHDDKIFSLQREFKTVDDDQDGVIDIYQLETMMRNVNPNVDIQKLVELLDPSRKGTIIFSFLCETFLQHPDFKDYFKGQN